MNAWRVRYECDDENGKTKKATVVVLQNGDETLDSLFEKFSSTVESHDGDVKAIEFKYVGKTYPK